MIKVSNLNKYYFKDKPNEIHVLNDVSLEFGEKGFVTILGPSGSGKSTLLNVIGGLDKAKGEICYNNLDFNKISNDTLDEYRNKNIGYIFQNYNLIHELSVYDNLKLQLELVGITETTEVDHRINNSLKVVGMDKYKRRNVTALSGGQQQRIAIARALVKGSRVIIADEPTGNLDSKNSVEVMNLLKVLSKRCLVILVTHNAELANHYSDRIIKIKDGKIIDDISNNNANSLLDSNSINSIYLDQYNSKKYDNIEVFTRNDENIQLRIVFDGVNLYIENKSNAIIKIVGEGTDKVFVETTPENQEVEMLDTTEVDFEEIINERNVKDTVLDFIRRIGKSFLNFFFAKKKGKALNFGFFLIGFILCLCFCSLSYCTYIESSILKNEPVDAIRVHPSQLAKDNKFGTSFEFKDLTSIIEADNGITSLVDKYDNPSFEYEFIGNRLISMSMGANCFLTTPKLYGYDIAIDDYEMIISDVVADMFIEYFYNFGIQSYSDLVGLQMRASFGGVLNETIFIKDVIDLDNKTFLVSDYLFFSYRTVPASTKVSYRYLSEGESLSGIVGESQYNPAINNFYVSNKLKNSFKPTIYDNVLGYFESENFELVFLNFEDYSKYVKELQGVAARLLPYDNSEIIEGTAPINKGEILLPDFLKGVYIIGSKYQNKYTVVGFYKVDFAKGIENAYISYEDAYLERLSYIYQSTDALKDTIDFYVSDRQKAIDYFKECGYDAYYIKDYLLENAEINKYNASQIAIVVSIVVVVVMIAFIFFISRSRMLKSVYTIGVYRSLGSKKSKIYSKYLIDGFVIATCTVVLGFTAMYLFSIYAGQYLPGVLFEFKYFILMILGIYGIVMLASVLPVIMLLRKTPIEILGKYDI